MWANTEVSRLRCTCTDAISGASFSATSIFHTVLTAGGEETAGPQFKKKYSTWKSKLGLTSNPFRRVVLSRFLPHLFCLAEKAPFMCRFCSLYLGHLWPIYKTVEGHKLPSWDGGHKGTKEKDFIKEGSGSFRRRQTVHCDRDGVCHALDLGEAGVIASRCAHWCINLYV